MTAPGGIPNVLFVDDDNRDEQVTLLEQLGASGLVRTPAQVTDADLVDADVIVVDHYLRLTKAEAGIEPDPDLPVFRRPQDGFAVAAVLRSRLDAMGDRHVAIALTSGRLDELAAAIPIAVREPLLAAQHDLDWAFRKTETSGEPDVLDRIVSLGLATRGLHGPVGDWARWLGLHDQAWAAEARLEVDEARPPVHGIASHTNGRALLRWLAQRALPFPTFLLSDLHAATRLGLTRDGFAAAAESGSPLGAVLGEARYRGPLADFTGPRWWAAAVDALLLEAGVDPYSPGSARAGLEQLHGGPLDALELDDPVVVIDGEYRAQPAPVERESALRLQPDGWPAWALTPYGLRSDPTIASLLAEPEKHRLSL